MLNKITDEAYNNCLEHLKEINTIYEKISKDFKRANKEIKDFGKQKLEEVKNYNPYSPKLE